jgi:hypothetical protein
VGGPAFIDRDVFPKYLAKHYDDIATIYGDLSRLVVAFVARAEPAEINALYTDLGWGGTPNSRAMHDAAARWMSQHRHPTSASR